MEVILGFDESGKSLRLRFVSIKQTVNGESSIGRTDHNYETVNLIRGSKLKIAG